METTPLKRKEGGLGPVYLLQRALGAKWQTEELVFVEICPRFLAVYVRTSIHVVRILRGQF